MSFVVLFRSPRAGSAAGSLLTLVTLATLAGTAGAKPTTPKAGAKKQTPFRSSRQKPVSPTPKAQSPKPSAQLISYNRDIRPILSDNCFQCHGPDKNTRAAGLRLDIREEALARGVLSPGKPEKSRLIARVFAKQQALLMPPVASHRKLSPAQKELLRRWVAQGAKYEAHWSFVPLPARVPVPAVKNAGWCRNEIDRFVLARLEKAGLKPSPEASRSDWLRRVTLDLTGLPPTPAELEAFLTDRAPQAYEKVVDRLLTSPRFGEQMAVPWLDVARYADSYGYQSDQLSPTWPYRDWVVQAFNNNLPYDRFITYQVAGDLLPNATREQRLATAFNRIHRMTNEGGSVPEEWRLEAVADRVNTFGTAFLGLTLECARCHDHKFDPISHRDYYSLSAFFNSIDEHGLYDRADIVPSPSLLLPTPPQEQQLAQARQALQQAEQTLAAARTGAEERFRNWLTSRPKVDPLPDRTGKFSFESFEGATLRNESPGATHHGARLDEVPLVPGKNGKAIQLDGENNVNFPNLGRFSRHTPFTISFWMYDPRIAAEPAVVFQACSGTDAGPHGYDLILEKGQLSARMFRHWPGNAIGVRTRTPIAKDAWTHVSVSYDGSSRAAGLKIYVNGKPAELETLRDRLVKGTGEHTLVFGQRFRDKGFKGGRIDDLRIFNRSLSGLELTQLFDGRTLLDALKNPAGHEAALREFYLSAIDPEARQAAAAVAGARQAVVQAEDAQFEVAVMDEMPQPRPAYVLERGQYDAPKTDANRVSRGTPSAVMPFPQGLRRDRLGLAEWLTRPGHPLTTRVAVNRFWSLFFGQGLVETSDNFGLQGKLPTHPELLDYLASRFSAPAVATSTQGGQGQGAGPGQLTIDNLKLTIANSSGGLGWDVKALLRLIVLSATYRQASALRPELQQKDPENLLLARGPSHRLSAEQIRDLALAASGLLDGRIGGPPVSPYQPGDLWREANVMSPAYRQSVGTDLYRRSLYSVLKRTAPMPNMLAFDAVSREVCVARRQTTSTPLQALVLLNDPQFVEAARVLGERMLKEGGATPAERVRFAFRRLAGRDPLPGEEKLLITLYALQLEHFRRQAPEAAQLLQIGDRKPDTTLSPAEVAAATVVAQAILNMDATVWKR